MRYLIIILIAFSFSNCAKDENQSNENQSNEKEAILKWTGAYAVDGCGYFIEMNSKRYKPENENIIDDRFQSETGINVIIEFEYLEENIQVSCGFSMPQLEEGIKLYSITEKNKVKKEALLSWTGAYEVDGCGFYIEIDDNNYKPENEEIIGESFQTTESTAVIVEFVYLNENIESWCGDLNYPQNDIGIRIFSLEEMNSEMFLHGEYTGNFSRKNIQTNEGSVSGIKISFSDETWTGESESEKYPALCRGTYVIENNKILFENQCAWTTEFDGSLILNGEYEFILAEDKIEFIRTYNNIGSNNYQDVYSLQKSEESN